MNKYLPYAHIVRPYHHIAWVFVLFISASMVAGAKLIDASDPIVACGLLGDHGLPTRGEYKVIRGGVHRCASRSRPLPLGGRLRQEIQYFAMGSAQKVSSLNLQLSIKSRENIPSAHKRLVQYTQHLLSGVLETDVPAEMEASILSGNNGKFQVKGIEAVVMKAHIRGITYELNVRLNL